MRKHCNVSPFLPTIMAMNCYNHSAPPTTQRPRTMGCPLQTDQEPLATAMGILNLGRASTEEPKKYYVVTKGRRPGIYTMWLVNIQVIDLSIFLTSSYVRDKSLEQTSCFSGVASQSHRTVELALKCWSDAFNTEGHSFNELVAASIPGDGDGGLFHLPGTRTQIQTQPQPFVCQMPRGEDSLTAWSREVSPASEHHPELVPTSRSELRGHSTHRHCDHSSKHHPELVPTYRSELGGHSTHHHCDRGSKHRGSAHERESILRTTHTAMVGHQNQRGSGEWWAILDGENPGIYAT